MNSTLTKQIIIRSAIETDAKALFLWQIDEDLNRYDPKPLPSRREELLESCQVFACFFKDEIMSDETGEYQYFMIANESNQPIGYINVFSIDEIKKEAELGIMIGNRNYQGKGVASYALNKVLMQIQEYGDLKRIYVETNVDNYSAVRLFERAGFIKVGIEDWGKGVFFQTMEKHLK
ncbi:hypothetical protein SANA_19040 [Gottschalkiaceae bacterium SANA]|nr:hypothetical protein SANA_19040 [Gottschalkiaceae bacterium SANA]